MRILSWNLSGAKYLERRSDLAACRRMLNQALRLEIQRHDPDVVTLQEVVEYQADGRVEDRESVIDLPDEYYYFPHMLLDTLRHSHQGRWHRVRKDGGWPPEAFFAQGNAILLKKDVPHFPLWSVPALHQDHVFWIARLPRRGSDAPGRGCMEVVPLESGLYAGDRDTEPRAALVLHLVLSRVGEVELPQPLDVFVINLHLTTLVREREGIQAIDARASCIRRRQLDIVLTDIVSRYHEWRARRSPETTDRRETSRRFPPLWIVAGDFNFTPDSPEYATMVRQGFISMVPGHTKARGVGKNPTVTLDYVFAGPRVEAIDPDRAEDYRATRNRVDVDDDVKVSDHLPLFAEIPYDCH